MAIEKEDRWLWLENRIRDMGQDLELIKIKLEIDDETLSKVASPGANDDEGNEALEW
tara:strand:+ start:254 stop:424 length:171 start_codon:yes stop_codon:yes gene_type:complete